MVRLPDDPAYPGPRDPSRVNMHDPVERAWRCEQWGCTPAELKAAIVGANGVLVDHIRVWMAREGRGK
jgi:hypothetical protein